MANHQKSQSPKRSGLKKHRRQKPEVLVRSSGFLLDKDLLRLIYQKMLQSRIYEERLIKIYKAGDGYFWIGGPGEEAFGVPLGLLVKKGQGPDFDYLHLHYRCGSTLIAMGMPMIEGIRLLMNRATDRHTGGRNFCSHYCIPEWNIMPVTSPIEVQYVMAIGTAIVQKKGGHSGITIVTGGDAGTHEGDFESALIWASRPVLPLPLLITVQNNGWGISTDYESQHGEVSIAKRAEVYGMPARSIDGNDPEESYLTLKELMDYVRTHQKPAFIEAKVSRLYGHSSASGANWVSGEPDPLADFEHKLLKAGFLVEAEIQSWRNQFEQEGFQAWQQVKSEPHPSPDSIWQYVYADPTEPNWRRF